MRDMNFKQKVNYFRVSFNRVVWDEDMWSDVTVQSVSDSDNGDQWPSQWGCRVVWYIF